MWWPQLFAPGGLLNLERDCVIGINIFGSCYGSTGPSSVDPDTGRMKTPLATPPAVGANVELVATYDSYTPNPAMITLKDGELPAAAKKPAATRPPAKKK